MIELRNPHSILAALERRPAAVRSVKVSSKRPSEAWEYVISAAQRNGVPVSFGGNQQLQRRRATERTGAGSANVEPPSPIPLDQVLKRQSNSRSNGLWLALDQIQDPQNLGAIFRLAGFFDVQGIILTKDRSAPVNGTTCDIAAGGVEYVPFAVVPNLVTGIRSRKERELSGSLELANELTPASTTSRADRDWMLVLGNEGDGMRRLDSRKMRRALLAARRRSGPLLECSNRCTAACLTVLTAPRK